MTTQTKSQSLIKLLALGITILHSCGVYAQREYPVPPPYEEQGYEDFYTFKYGRSFVRDPWVWGYTQEFAERFRMPKQWIEPELKGILAVAFRMNKVGNDKCGLGGRVENCWPHLECQMDIYYDTAIDSKLPWSRPDIMRDSFIGGVLSNDFLHSENRYIKYRDPQQPNEVRGTGVGFGLSINNKRTHFFSLMNYYDRQLYEGVGLISVEGGSVCPYEVGPAKGLISESIIVGKAAKERFDKSYKHEAFLPESYMRRAYEAYERDKKPNDAMKQKLIEDFIKSRPQ